MADAVFPELMVSILMFGCMGALFVAVFRTVLFFARGRVKQYPVNRGDQPRAAVPFEIPFVDIYVRFFLRVVIFLFCAVFLIFMYLWALAAGSLGTAGAGIIFFFAVVFFITLIFAGKEFL